ncbi:apoptosis facilitator Bcl-2-like protein 14 [Girardinichthys multiradiatus]|uniref:apoptosis facilitator Bcl-2-like protein 14 n=1 Tax=Girardinichthys multiradiatus TaxID=208333 RepID=UPI001FAE222E|nr:apoptosis facilitator Bcl-2-like protein 14 [Girardinichthys multiradiatus]
MECLQESSNVLQLLEEYCRLRSCPKVYAQYQGPSIPLSRRLSGFRQFSFYKADTTSQAESVNKESTVPERLANIVVLPPFTGQNLQTQDEIIQRLVQLMITFGDDINVKLKQNPALQQQLQNLNYNLFEKLTSTMQNLVAPSGRAAGSDSPVQQQRIAWVFELTSRLSAITVVHRRTVLQFGTRYIEENHAGWVQQHGGWEEAFD